MYNLIHNFFEGAIFSDYNQCYFPSNIKSLIKLSSSKTTLNFLRTHTYKYKYKKRGYKCLVNKEIRIRFGMAN